MNISCQTNPGRWIIDREQPKEQPIECIYEPTQFYEFGQEQHDDSGITPRVENTLNYLKSLNVEIHQPGKIRDYLIQHIDMLPLLNSISERTRLKFMAAAQLSLKLNQEAYADDEYLILYVRQNHYDEGVMKRIKQIRNEYGYIMAYSSGWLLLTTDFRLIGNTNDV